MTDDDLDRFVTISEAAQRLHMHRSTAYRLIEAGTFPVPTVQVGGKQVVSLRRLADYMANAA